MPRFERRLRRATAFAFACLWLPAALPAQTFEGAITVRSLQAADAAVLHVVGDTLYEVTEDRAVDMVLSSPVERFIALAQEGSEEVALAEATVFVQGSKMRLESANPMLRYVIADFSSGEAWVVSPRERAYWPWTRADSDSAAVREQRALGEMGAVGARPGAAGLADSASNVEPLGRSATINGAEAVGYQLRTHAIASIGWCVEAPPEVIEVFERMASTLAAAEVIEGISEVDLRQLFLGHGLPVRVQTYKVASGVYEIDDVLAVNERALSPDLFQPPPDYTQRASE